MKFLQLFIVISFICIVTNSCKSSDDDLTNTDSETEIDSDTDTDTDTDESLDITGYPIVDTNLKSYYNNTTSIVSPVEGDAYYGQDANYNGNQPSYTDNGDSTITDNNTGLMWQKYMGEMKSWDDAMADTATARTGGYNDWRMPTVKELYSLMEYSGQCKGENSITKFIDTLFFDQPLGSTDNDGREIYVYNHDRLVRDISSGGNVVN